MAKPVTNTARARAKSQEYARQIFRRSFLELLYAFDTATIAEQELAQASEGQPGGACDPAVATYLQRAEKTWDAVTDAMRVATTHARPVPNTCPVHIMLHQLNAIIGSETASEYATAIASARGQIAASAVRPGMTAAAIDAHQLLRAAERRLDGLSALNIRPNNEPLRTPHLTLV